MINSTFYFQNSINTYPTAHGQTTYHDDDTSFYHGQWGAGLRIVSDGTSAKTFDRIHLWWNAGGAFTNDGRITAYGIKYS